MKRVLLVLLSIIIVFGVVSVAVAETDIENGMLVIHEVIEYVFDRLAFDSMFNKDSFIIAQTYSGDIVVEVEAAWLVGTPARDRTSTAGAISNVWDMFASSSKKYTDAKVYFYVNYDGETIYFATPMGVLDVQTETLYNHIQQ